MPFEEEIQQLASTIWDSILHLPIEPGDPAAAVDEPQMMAACVQITGAWQGAVSLACGEAFATSAASIMFELDEAAVGVADRQDALGELANMIGGNMKALLPEPCALSLPSVVAGTEYSVRIPHSKVITRVPLNCGGRAIRVVLFEKDAA
jgi:chemotaxis protein CheX